MDLVGYDQIVFDNIITNYKLFSKSIGIKEFTAIPITGLLGDNIASKSQRMKWFNGSTLINHLENVKIDQRAKRKLFYAVQWVNRPNLDFRGFSGKIADGKVKPRDKIRILPSGTTSIIDPIVTFDGDLDSTSTGQSITLTLKDEIEYSRGQIITSTTSRYRLQINSKRHLYGWPRKHLYLVGHTI